MRFEIKRFIIEDDFLYNPKSSIRMARAVSGMSTIINSNLIHQKNYKNLLDDSDPEVLISKL